MNINYPKAVTIFLDDTEFSYSTYIEDTVNEAIVNYQMAEVLSVTKLQTFGHLGKADILLIIYRTFWHLKGVSMDIKDAKRQMRVISNSRGWGIITAVHDRAISVDFDDDTWKIYKPDELHDLYTESEFLGIHNSKHNW